MSIGLSGSKNKSKSVSQQQSLSANQAYPFIDAAYIPTVNQGNQASGLLSSMLGLNGQSAQMDGFNQFRNSGNYNFIRDEGINGITSNNAARGLLRSGSTLRGITKYSTDLASSYLDKYLAALQGLTNTGLTAGDLITRAGSYSTSSGNASGSGSGSSFGFNFSKN